MPRSTVALCRPAQLTSQHTPLKLLSWTSTSIGIPPSTLAHVRLSSQILANIMPRTWLSDASWSTSPKQANTCSTDLLKALRTVGTECHHSAQGVVSRWCPPAAPGHQKGRPSRSLAHNIRCTNGKPAGDIFESQQGLLWRYNHAEIYTGEEQSFQTQHCCCYAYMKRAVNRLNPRTCTSMVNHNIGSQVSTMSPGSGERGHLIRLAATFVATASWSMVGPVCCRSLLADNLCSSAPVKDYEE